ncbi:hypothetical protein E1B28_011405 [Marasmius oreades]|uniref:Metal homeostatis protein BSD2 n=1 Tax=Marasmius oreades TaxID=181124 RepID=A0A9P7RV30_9AGAR|nr:uncharacterized protein E1B28_011405 [Marasmius oreades]KAG7089751.1 hypothetical protein E1B28_011405 [Marasmius oreades]
MPARYSPLPNNNDAERELNAAFDDEEDDDDENTPLNNIAHSDLTINTPVAATTENSGTYDFERDYDVPPPGSPPAPSSFALPNDYGNSNGFLPTSPIQAPRRTSPSFFRRVVGAVLPTHYARVPTEDSSISTSRVLGGGVENDGVFANVTAKPQPAQVIRTSEGNIHLVPEETQKEAPPSYQSAQADAVPPYWETTVVAPAVPGQSGSDMIIEDLPSGSVWVFFINAFISFFFNFIGFLLTFLLHTSHAGKFGSRAGLGLTLIQYGFYTRTGSVLLEVDGSGNDAASGMMATGTPLDPASPMATGTPTIPDPSQPDNLQEALSSSRDWVAFICMTIGWFLLLTSCIGFWRIKRWESSIRDSSTPSAPRVVTPEQIQRERDMRANLEAVFGISFDEDERPRTIVPAAPQAGNNSISEPTPPLLHRVHLDEHGHAVIIPTQDLEEMALERDLRAAGLF